MRKYFATYLPFTKGILEESLSFGFEVCMWLLGETLFIFANYFLWKAIFNSSGEPIIKGFTFPQMVVYILISRLMYLLLTSQALEILLNEIIDGRIAMNLIKPIRYQSYLLFSTLGSFIFILGIVAITFLVSSTILYFILGIVPANIIYIIFTLISILFGVIIGCFFDTIIGLFGFYTTAGLGLYQFRTCIIMLCSGAIIPLVFFPSWLQNIMNFLPFKFMLTTPTLIYLGKYSIKEIFIQLGLQLFWIGILYIISHLLWKKSIKNLMILGG